MTKHTWLSIFTLILIQYGNAFAAPAAATDPEWDPIDLSMTDIRFQIDRETCGQGERNVLGCISAVNRWAAVLQIDAEFVPERDTKKDPAFSQVIHRFKRLVMVKKKTKSAFEEDSAHAFLQNFQQSKQSFLERYSQFAKDFKHAPESEFEDIAIYLQELSEKPAAHRPSKRQIAEILNEYLRIAFSPRDFYLSNIAIAKREKVTEEKADFGFSGHEVARGFLVQGLDSDFRVRDSGLQTWDVITEVNGRRLSQLPRGRKHIPLLEAKGDVLHLTIQRKEVGIDTAAAWKTVSLQLSRTVRTKNNFTSTWREAFNEKWLQIKFANYDLEGICQLMKNAVQKGETENAQGYVIDLRKNGGGAMRNLHCLAGIFLGPGKTILVAHGKDSEPEKSEGEQLTQKPVVILQDEETASSAEIFAAALRDHQRALIVGNLSFGKGSFQNCDFDRFKKELRRCKMGAIVYTPAGRTFQGEGLTPDVQVYRSKEPSEAEIYALREKDKYLFPVVVPAAGNSISENLDSRPLTAPRECLEARRQRAISESLVSGEILNDFQLLTGLSTLSCLWPSEGK